MLLDQSHFFAPNFQMKRFHALLLSLCLAGPSLAADRMDEKTEDFVAANMIAIFYHELGHALIDIMKLPIFGQEEDAADVLSAVLIDDFFTGQTAIRIAYATAFGFLGDTDLTSARNRDVAYWDVHGPDLQRYYTFVCLFYGAKPEEREEVARELKLPKGRKGTCKDEFAQAKRSWGPVIDGLMATGSGKTIRFLADHRVDDYGKLAADVIAREVKAMNKDLSLPKRLLVRVEACDTVNAFYNAKTREITMCTEFSEWLAGVVPK
jgi:hypothetical protein